MSAMKTAVVPGLGAPRDLTSFFGSVEVDEWPSAKVEKLGAIDPRAGIIFLFADADPAEQKRLLACLGRGGSKKAVVALYAPALSVSELAAAYPWPEQVVGFDFLDHMLELGGLIEVAPGLRTDPGATDTVEKFLKARGFETERVGDFSGLVLRRVLFMIINEAAYALWEGVASREDIDLAMKLGTNYPLGPLEWADAISLDRVYTGLKSLQEEYGDDRYRPCPLIRKMVMAGFTGKRAGQGFYTYNGEVTS